VKILANVGVAAFCLAISAFPARAGDEFYRYMKAPELEQKLKAKEPVILFDIQVEEEFTKHHITGATPTYAYPVKSPEDRAKVDAVLDKVTGSTAPVVIVCPRGAGGAERTYAYLKEKGVAPERLYILEKGQAGWSCADLTEGR
jgi:rhodanese-related sulfurtransferase